MVIITLLEYFLEPFTRNYSEHIYDYWIICLFHAGVITLSYLITYILFGFIPRPKVWKLKNELLFAGVLIVIGGIGNFFVRELIYDIDNLKWRYFFEELRHGILAGSLFYFLIFNLNRYLYNSFRADNSEKSNEVEIEAYVSADSFSIDPNQILCVKSDGNYTEFYLIDGINVSKRIVRQTLEKVAEQLSSHSQFFRSHRAFIVNIQMVKEHKGNASGYQLVIDGLEFLVPVSRANVKKYNEHLAHH